MSSTLSEGVRVPDIGSVNWGADVNFNWGLLNTALANISGNVKVDVENTWTAPQTFTETISGSITRAVGDEDGTNIKAALAGKQPSLSQAQLDAVNSGVTAAAVQQIGTNTSNISALQTAVASKAADNAVVHLAGAETITGEKTHDADLAITGNHLFVWNRPQLTMGTIPSSVIYWGTERYRDSGGSSFCLRRGYVGTTGDVGLWTYVYGWSAPAESAATRLTISADGSDSEYTVKVKSFRPYNKSVSNCGTSEYKFATFNGINPGALSLPSNSGVSFSGDITDTTGTVANPKTWTVNGWGYIRVPNRTTSDFVSVVTSGSYEAYLATGTGAGNTNIGVSFPIVAGRTYNIYVSTSGNVTAYFFPCLGNV